MTGYVQKTASSNIRQAEASLSETESSSLNERLERLRSQFEENDTMISGRLILYKVDE